MKFPLIVAWLQLTHTRTRLLIALAGIAFAVILMFMQLGFSDGLYNSNIRVHTKLKSDIFLISSRSIALNTLKTFSERRLYQAQSFDGVESISSVYLDFGFWTNPENYTSRQILILGINPDEDVLDLPEVEQNIDKIKIPDVVLFDRDSRPEFGPIATEFDQGITITTEVNNRQITIGSLFELGTSFAANGTLITSDLNFLRIFSNKRQQGLIDIGLIRLKPGVNVENLVETMRKELPQDVKVLSKQEFIQLEKDYWQSSTAIGFIFTVGTIMGFMVGAVIVYQILYSDVSEHLAEYATLKAMGYKSTFLFSVVFQEAIILSILGYIPGFALCLGLYDMTRNATMLPIFMTFSRAATVVILTILMCAASGAIAIRKVQSADPADIF
ncbi:FtsX-like permease family protein [Nostoc sp. CENA67]|uniref:FtsX-like permease family protein n=1 Tax=Amazonocrinis nigriterrae CENA67 TaxID=2794033 RepID=A0A8J7I190_9NOST|nr:ABC transporter permease DevC [Amazonocrinis nigriterrae]MBH8567018.1 FtsX-like permease family protein [Amazonocrinis nigriterrae CENA67]